MIGIIVKTDERLYSNRRMLMLEHFKKNIVNKGVFCLLILIFLFLSFLALVKMRVINENNQTEYMAGQGGYKELLYDRTKVVLANFVFKLMPDKRRYFLSKQNIKQVIDKEDQMELKFLIQVFGPEVIINKLLTESKNGDIFNCHSYAHVVGRLSYITIGAEEVLDKQILICSEGYTHSVIASMVEDYGIEHLTKNITEFCERSKKSLKRGCYHGSGHGIMGYFDYNLPLAIKTCKEYQTTFQKENCLTGVFMENIASRVGGALSPHETKWLSNKDPYFPCNKVDKDWLVQNDCYGFQPWWLFTLHKENPDKNAKVRELCIKANPQFVTSCLFGYGQNAALNVNFDIAKMIENCEKVPKVNNYYANCVFGEQMSYIQFLTPFLNKKGDLFCTRLDERYKKTCRKILSDRIEAIKKLQ